MQNHTKVFLIILLAIFSTCKEPPTEVPLLVTEITGKVFDKKTGTPLSGVQVTTLPVTSSIITGSDGSYTLSDIDPGTYKVTAQKDGYNTNSTYVTADEGKSVSADILLETQSAELKVNPEALDFDVGQTNLTFNITNLTNVGEVTWSIGLNQPWLSVSPSSGSTTTETDIITVVVNRDSLEFGNYSALITINSDFGSEQVNVIMIKANPNAPQISITPMEIDFGTSNDFKTLLLKNTGTGMLTWTATTNESWLILSSSSGSTTGGSSSTLTVSVNKTDLLANNYTGMILINSNGGSEVINVAMTIPQGTLSPPELQVIGGATKTSIPLGWTKVNDSNFSNYKLYRSIINNVDEGLFTKVCQKRINL